MLQGQDRAWFRYVKDIIAADVHSAVFLAAYMHEASFRVKAFSTLEIVDMQKYKVIKDIKKIRGSFRERQNQPFVFIVNKN